MSQVDRLVLDLRQAWAGEPWHGSSLTTLLKDVDATIAAAHPISGGHSIWETVIHLTVWTREVTRRLHGRPAQVPAEGDWPVVGDCGASAWTRAREELTASHAELERVLVAVPESRLGETVGTAEGGTITQERMLSGLLQHDAYHGGQIALLKKAQRAVS